MAGCRILGARCGGTEADEGRRVWKTDDDDDDDGWMDGSTDLEDAPAVDVRDAC
jgi:hypothetical protein